MKVNIDDMQLGFMSRKETVDAIFIVRRSSWKRGKIFSMHL